MNGRVIAGHEWEEQLPAVPAGECLPHEPDRERDSLVSEAFPGDGAISLPFSKTLPPFRAALRDTPSFPTRSQRLCIISEPLPETPPLFRAILRSTPSFRAALRDTASFPSWSQRHCLFSEPLPETSPLFPGHSQRHCFFPSCSQRHSLFSELLSETLPLSEPFSETLPLSEPFLETLHLSEPFSETLPIFRAVLRDIASFPSRYQRHCLFSLPSVGGGFAAGLKAPWPPHAAYRPQCASSYPAEQRAISPGTARTPSR
jgi:hypothetical protein